MAAEAPVALKSQPRPQGETSPAGTVRKNGHNVDAALSLVPFQPALHPDTGRPINHVNGDGIKFFDGKVFVPVGHVTVGQPAEVSAPALSTLEDAVIDLGNTVSGIIDSKPVDGSKK